MKTKHTPGLFCLKSPRGTLLYQTITKWDGPKAELCSMEESVWVNSFSKVAQLEGDEWAVRFWKKLHPSMASAMKLGYSFVRIGLIEIFPHVPRRSALSQRDKESNS